MRTKKHKEEVFEGDFVPPVYTVKADDLAERIKESVYCIISDGLISPRRIITTQANILGVQRSDVFEFLNSHLFNFGRVQYSTINTAIARLVDESKINEFIDRSTYLERIFYSPNPTPANWQVRVRDGWLCPKPSHPIGNRRSAPLPLPPANEAVSPEARLREARERELDTKIKPLSYVPKALPAIKPQPPAKKKRNYSKDPGKNYPSRPPLKGQVRTPFTPAQVELVEEAAYQGLTSRQAATALGVSQAMFFAVVLPSGRIKQPDAVAAYERGNQRRLAESRPTLAKQGRTRPAFTQAELKTIEEMARRGETIRAIAQKLQISPSSFQNALRLVRDTSCRDAYMRGEHAYYAEKNRIANEFREKTALAKREREEREAAELEFDREMQRRAA